MELRVLGSLEVGGAAGRLALGGVQQRAVLAMLTLHLNEVVSTDFLVDGLWGQRAPVCATNTVQVYVSRLRKVLGGANGPDGAGAAVLPRRGAGYVLELDPGQVDLYRFRRLAQVGTQALTVAPIRAASLLREALGLWRGQPLAEFADQPFASVEAPRLEQQRMAAEEAWLKAELALGRHAESVGELKALVARYPLHEGLLWLLMLGLYRCGRQAEALEAYRRARHTLSEELGINPGPALRRLEAAILAHDADLEWTSPADEPPIVPIETLQAAAPQRSQVTASVPVMTVWNGPARDPHLTGREDALAELRRRSGAGEPTLALPALYGLVGGQDRAGD